ncbi:MAG: serine/threonine protein kinase [Myxococcales bacterium]|nr:serine/threonine protein kinase [Myxococcales bacterium]
MDEQTLAPGTVIGNRYRLEALIGQGAFSEVYRATDLKDGAGVALKVLSRESVDAAGLDRFRREAELATRLKHENTIRLLAFNLRTGPVPFIVYELLDGETLQSLMKREGPLGEARAANITMRVLNSLLEAHEVGIIHRDIKPENVFVCSAESRTGSVKVLDFGIAKSVEAAEVQVTAAGILIGTPRYMPPEQIRGADPIPAMDIYATGVMLAEMLSGEPVLTCSAAEACLEQLRAERLPFPAFLGPSRLGEVIWRATDKELATRYSTVNEMLGELERVYPLLSPAPLVTRTAPDEGARVSYVPTTVMENPERQTDDRHLPTDPGPAPAPARRSASWLVAAALLFLSAIALTAYGIYWVRTTGAL